MAEREISPKRCLVLGGSGYVGASVCRALVAAGARLAFTYWNGEASAQALARELIGSQARRVDLTDYQLVGKTVEQASESLGGLDALVQCAGTAGDPSLYQSNGKAKQDKFLKISEGEWDAMMDLTAKSTFAACQAAARSMETSGGQIVIIGSMDGVKSVPAPVHYASAKGALRAMVAALAKELGDRKILVNMIAPGVLEGGLGKLLSDELLQDYLKHCSFKRTGSAPEIAELVSWLVLENTYLTGQTMVLDGGL